ncbi:MAG: hypothetical protein IIC61_14670 [Proteobacteria bacterium]|nr:hypothetical protein [Pseudomonadota bacterium]
MNVYSSRIVTQALLSCQYRFQLKDGNINQYNWQTVDDITGADLPTGKYCVRVILLTNGQFQETGIIVR